MQFANLLTKFYFDTWGIRPDKHAAMGRLLNDYIKARVNAGDVIGPKFHDGEPVVPQMEVGAGVAIIPINGVLGKHLSMLELMCGGCDYGILGQFVDDAASDNNVHTILLNINSPGGMVVGLPEFCAKLAAARVTKRLIAYSDGECASCAIRVAIEADEVYFSPSSIVGSIGTYIAALDNSREWEQEGWKLELFRSGALKGIGLDGKEFTDQERAFLQGRVDKAGNEFKAAVRARRGVVADETMQGQWFNGDEAPGLGLSDGVINDFQELVNAAIVSGG